MESTSQNQPNSLTELFVAFTVLAIQGFGGVLAVAQRELVERRRWLSNEEFVEEWAIAQTMPGPNVVNMALMLGGRHFGLPGALAAVAGMLLLPLATLLLLAIFYEHYAGLAPVAGALRGMGAVAAGLIIATGLKMLPALRRNPLGMRLCVALGVACFAGIALLRWPLAYVLLPLGLVACYLAYRRLTP